MDPPARAAAAPLRTPLGCSSTLLLFFLGVRIGALSFFLGSGLGLGVRLDLLILSMVFEGSGYQNTAILPPTSSLGHRKRGRRSSGSAATILWGGQRGRPSYGCQPVPQICAVRQRGGPAPGSVGRRRPSLSAEGAVWDARRGGASGWPSAATGEQLFSILGGKITHCDCKI